MQSSFMYILECVHKLFWNRANEMEMIPKRFFIIYEFFPCIRKTAVHKSSITCHVFLRGLSYTTRWLGVAYLDVSCDNYNMKVRLFVGLLIKYQVGEN